MGRQKTRNALDGRRRLLAALFKKAARQAIDQRTLRDEIAPGVIGKRLSEASPQEIVRVIEHVAGLYGLSSPRKNYPPSRAGLIEELEDAARERWGEGFPKPLIAFINSHRGRTLTHYRFMKIAELKAFKYRIRALNRRDGI